MNNVMHYMHGLSFYTYLEYYAKFFFFRYCILQYSHAGTWLTLFRTEDFFEEKKIENAHLFNFHYQVFTLKKNRKWS